jgi:hypothetical protein
MIYGRSGANSRLVPFDPFSTSIRWVEQKEKKDNRLQIFAKQQDSFPSPTWRPQAQNFLENWAQDRLKV